MDERLDVDLADTALPIEALILGLCRELGVAAAWLDTIRGTSGETTAKVAAWPESPYGIGRYRPIPPADLGLPEGQVYMLNTDTSAVFNEAGAIVRTLSDQPVPAEPESGIAGRRRVSAPQEGTGRGLVSFPNGSAYLQLTPAPKAACGPPTPSSRAQRRDPVVQPEAAPAWIATALRASR